MDSKARKITDSSPFVAEKRNRPIDFAIINECLLVNFAINGCLRRLPHRGSLDGCTQSPFDQFMKFFFTGLDRFSRRLLLSANYAPHPVGPSSEIFVRFLLFMSN